MCDARRFRQIQETSPISTADILIRNIVSALRGALAHTLDTPLRINNTNVNRVGLNAAFAGRSHRIQDTTA